MLPAGGRMTCVIIWNMFRVGWIRTVTDSEQHFATEGVRFMDDLCRVGDICDVLFVIRTALPPATRTVVT